MEILDRIDAYKTDIYFKMPSELNHDYVKICEQIAAFFEKDFALNEEVLKECNTLLEHLFMVMQTNDYIKMADELYYTVKPILDDTASI